MGRVKQDALEHWERGLTSVPEKMVCHRHFTDYAIRDSIKANVQAGKCSYCKKTGATELETLMFFMMEGVMNFYEDAAGFMRYDSNEGGYQGEIFSQDELINDEIGLDVDDNVLREDIINSIDDRAWATPNSYYDSQRDILVYHWGYFKDVAKHKARYLFAQTTRLRSFDYQLNPYLILEDIGRYISEFQMVSYLSKGAILSRCRQHLAKDLVIEAKDISSPPLEKATMPSRMSPAGIPMFYCAFDKETAKAETIIENDLSKPKVTTCNFKVRKDLKVIDFGKLPKRISMFDTENFREYHVVQFLHEFVADLSKGIKRDGKEHIEYVPTQILTEYFRYMFPETIHGIVYPSSKRKGSNSCVLFFDQNESIKHLHFQKQSLLTEDI